MSFEVGALCVSLPTADVVTRVCRNPLPGPGAPTTFGLRLLRQAVTAGDHEGICGVKRSWSSSHTRAWLEKLYIPAKGSYMLRKS